MAIHHVNVKPETTATLLEAAEQARMTLLDFEGWVLDDWARLYRLEQARAGRTDKQDGGDNEQNAVERKDG